MSKFAEAKELLTTKEERSDIADYFCTILLDDVEDDDRIILASELIENTARESDFRDAIAWVLENEMSIDPVCDAVSHRQMIEWLREEAWGSFLAYADWLNEGTMDSYAIRALDRHEAIRRAFCMEV